KWQRCEDCRTRLWYHDKATGVTEYFTGEAASSFIGMVSCVAAGHTQGIDAKYLDKTFTVYVSADGDIFMIADTGCKRSVAGPGWHAAMQAACAKVGLRPIDKQVDESFKFGDGDVVFTTLAYIYPVGVYGKMGKLDVAYIDRDCPGLLSRTALKEIGADLLLTQDVCKIGDIVRPIMDSQAGHPMLQVNEFGDLSAIPTEFKLDSNADFSYIGDDTEPEEHIREKTSYVTEARDTFKRLAHGVRKKLSKCAEVLHGAFFEDARSLRSKVQRRPLRRPRILEICTWTCMLTSVAVERGWSGFSPISLETGYDLTTTRGRTDAWGYLNRVDPDLVVCAFPCTPWSRLQHMNKRTEQQRARLEQMQEDHRGITRFVAKVRTRQRSRGAHFATEQPWSASSQNLPEIKETVFDCNEGFLNMCMHNLRCPETGYLLKKDT
ncbi:MAG: hypothetical protein VYC81_05540, partial [Actinomycetota bacterium]|nr:hypothetical protein [Actinomycetota bacterium]